jgi:hypothetical protein
MIRSSNRVEWLTSLFLLIQAWLGMYSLYKPIDPTISWTNAGRDPPIITLYFASDAVFKRPLLNFWIRIDLPFNVYSLSPSWAAITDCKKELQFVPALEEMFSQNQEYSSFYVQLTGATFVTGRTFVLKIKPDRSLDFSGFAPPMRLALISLNADNHIVFAYNNAFFHLIGSEPSIDNLIVKTLSFSTGCTLLTTYCLHRISVKLGQGPAVSRFVVRSLSGYTLASNSTKACSISGVSNVDLSPFNQKSFSCKPSSVFGDQTRDIVFDSSSQLLPGTYTLEVPMVGPFLLGSHSYEIFTMKGFSGQIINSGSQRDAFETQALSWAEGYPKMSFSYGFSADDENLSLSFGLYSTSSAYNMVLNSIRIKFKISNLPSQISSQNQKIRFYLGTTYAIAPLSKVRTNLPAIPGSERLLKRIGDTLVFERIILESDEEYYISLKIGFTDAGLLNNVEPSVFGTVELLVNDNPLASGYPSYKAGFLNVINNKNIISPEGVDKTENGFHRGRSAFRSEKSSALNQVTSNYFSSPTNNGLRIGDNQEFWVQTSLSATQLYSSANGFASNHNSTRTFLEILTPTSIVSTQASNDDSNAQTNCKFYASHYQKWSNELGTTEAQNVLDPTIWNQVAVPLASYNPIMGCMQDSISFNSSGSTVNLNRFRMRFKDLYTNNQNGTTVQIVGAGLAFPNQMIDNNLASVKKGGLYVFNKVTISLPTGSDTQLGPDDDLGVFDAYFFVFFFSSMTSTNQTILSTPSIYMMDNLIILNSPADVSVTPSQLKISFQNAFYTEPSAGNKVLNDNSQFPTFMVLKGNLGPLPVNTTSIRILFDFVEPIPVNSFLSERVSCVGWNGSSSESMDCIRELGQSDFSSSNFLSWNLIPRPILLYSYKLANSILWTPTAQQLTATQSFFTLIFPVAIKYSSNIESFLQNDGSGVLMAYPSFQLLDSSRKVIQQVDFGATGANFQLSCFKTAMKIASLDVMPSSTVQKIDDPAQVIKPPTYGFFSPTLMNVGGVTDGVLNVVGTGFVEATQLVQDFTSVTFCSSWNFARIGFSAAFTGSANEFSSCYNLVYNGINCMLCLRVVSPSSAFQFSNFTLPSSNGLKWPSGSVLVIASPVPSIVIDQMYLSKAYQPNFLSLNQTFVSLPVPGYSFPVTLIFSLTNPLPPKGFIGLGRVSGSFLFLIKGDNSKPLCTVMQGSTDLGDCSYAIIGNFLIARIINGVSSNTSTTLSFFGLSAESATTTNPDLVMEVFTAQDDSLTQNQKIDSSLPQNMTFSWKNSIGSGQLSLQNMSLTVPVSQAISDLKFTVVIDKRVVSGVDELYVNLGTPGLVRGSQVLIFDSRNNSLLDICKTVEAVSSQELLIRFSNTAVYETNFTIAVYGFRLPSVQAVYIQLTYNFNNGFKVFEAQSVSLPAFFSVTGASGETALRYGSYGFNSALDFKLKMSSSVNPTDILFFRFPMQVPPRISTFQVSAFERNFGPNTLKSWIASPRVLAVTGFSSVLDGGRSFGVSIFGLQLASDTNSAEVYLASSSGLTATREFTSVLLPDVNNSNSVLEIKIRGLDYKPRILKSFGFLAIRLGFPKLLSLQHTVIVDLNSLTDEIYKSFSMTCGLFRVKTGVQAPSTNSSLNFNDLISKEVMNSPLAALLSDPDSPALSLLELGDLIDSIVITEQCQINGSSIASRLLEDGGYETLLVFKGIPMPDFDSCKLVQPSIRVANGPGSKVIMHSSLLTSNVDPAPMASSGVLQPLNFKLNQVGKVNLLSGFYETVEVYIDKLPMYSTFFQKEISFVLMSTYDNLFSVQRFLQSNYKPCRAAIGSSRVQLVVGTAADAINFTYPLTFNRQESGALFYGELPILRAAVINRPVNLIVPTIQVWVYKEGRSMPIPVKLEKSPIDDIYVVASLSPNADGKLFLKDSNSMFSFSMESVVSLIRIVGSQDADVGSIATLYLEPQNSPLVVRQKVELIVVEQPPEQAEPVDVSFSNIGPNTLSVVFSSQACFAAFFYLMPTNLFVPMSQSFIENMIQRGAVQRGETFFGMVNLFRPSGSLSFDFQDLTENTNYTLFGFYEYLGTISSDNFTFEVATKQIDSNKHSSFLINFTDVIFQSLKMIILCHLSFLIAIPREDLWTDEGANCELSFIPKYVQAYHYEQENAINASIISFKTKISSEMSDSGSSSNSTTGQPTNNSAANGSQPNSTRPETAGDPSSSGISLKEQQEMFFQNLTSVYPNLKYMRVRVYGSRRESQPKNNFLRITDFLTSNNLTQVLNTFLEQQIVSSVELIEELVVDNEIAPPKTIGSADWLIDPSNASFKLTNYTTDASQRMLFLLAPKGKFVNPLPSQLMSLNGFIAYRFALNASSSPLNLKFPHLEPNINYTLFYTALNNDDRISVMISKIQSLDFLIPTIDTIDSSVFLPIVFFSILTVLLFI